MRNIFYIAIILFAFANCIACTVYVPQQKALNYQYVINSHYKNTYNKHGKLKAVSMTSEIAFSEQDKKYLEKQKYTYTKDGELISMVAYQGKNRWNMKIYCITQYSKNHHQKNYFEEGKLIINRNEYFDSIGNISKIDFTYKKDKERTILFEYDEYNNEVSRKNYDTLNELSFSQKAIYNTINSDTVIVNITKINHKPQPESISTANEGGDYLMKKIYKNKVLIEEITSAKDYIDTAFFEKGNLVRSVTLDSGGKRFKTTTYDDKNNIKTSSESIFYAPNKIVFSRRKILRLN